MTKEELIEMLNILLDNAKVGCADITIIHHVSFDSFKFVIEQTIMALSQEPIKYWIDYNGHVTPIQQPCDTENCKIVKALIGDPCKVKEPCTDAVSREEVKKIVDFYSEQYDGIFHVNESIDELPSVTIMREDGK